MKQKRLEAASMQSLGRLVRYMLHNYKVPFALVVLCILAAAVATLRGTVFIQSLVDDYILPMLSTQNPDFSPLARALTGLAALYAVGIVAAYAYNRIMVNVSQGTMKRLRIQLFTRMESLPISYFDTHAHGDIMSVYTNDVDTLRQFLSQSVPQTIHAAVTLVVTLVSMLILNIPLTLITLVMACVMLFVTRKLSGLSGKYFGLQQRDLGAVDGYIEEMLDGQKVVKVFCHEQKAMDQFRVLNDRLRESADKANAYANITMPINANIGNLSYVLCAVIGALLALNGVGGVTVGAIVAFVSLNKSFTQPITQISQQMNSIVMAAAGAQRVFEMMDQAPEQDEGYVEMVNAKEQADGTLVPADERTGMWAWKHPHKADGTVTYTKLEGGIVFDGVDFGYTDEKIVLHDIKLYAEPGQKIAFVGSTGAGKTTITNLINRFYDIQDGKIRYDGINITKIKKPALRRTLGIVLQDTHLFTGTVMDNIRYGNLEATDEECIAAAKLANAHGFIERLPDGYNTLLTGDGANLSQGQRQLLAIARAAVADPPVLILDEATSALDNESEHLVGQSLARLAQGRTTLTIAHRLTTIQHADRILVLGENGIEEEGTHEELMAKHGVYHKLWTGAAALDKPMM